MKKGVIFNAVKSRKITFFLTVAVLIWGLYSYYILPKQEYPDIKAPVALVSVVYPGAAPEIVEKLVTRKIEDEIVKVPGFDYMNSYSNHNVSVVFVRLEPDADIDSAWEDLRLRMNDLQGKLPKECKNVEINTDLVDTAGVILSLSGENYTNNELNDIAENIKSELSEIKGISKFEVNGKEENNIFVDVDYKKLNVYRLSIDEILNRIKAENVEIPSGNISYNGNKISLKTKGAYESVEDIKNTILYVIKETGETIKLGDIAKVYIGRDSGGNKIKFNKSNAVLLCGYFKENKNIVLIGKEIDRKLYSIKDKLPSDIELNKVLYQPESIRTSINSFIINLLEGMIFVIIVVLIGMGIRNALIISTAIPVSIMITFVFMNLLGIKIHQISISALIVALGMLVDNAIVVSDAIQARLDSGQEKMEACIMGIKEVAVPVFTSTITTVAAFLPLLLLSSIAGEYISSLPIIVSISLFASYIVALFLTPAMAYIFFDKRKSNSRQWIIRTWFNNFLTKSIKRRGIVILTSFLLIALGFWLFSDIDLQFFPKADTDIIYIDLKADHKNDISETEKLTAEVSDLLLKQKEVQWIVSSVGDSLPKFYNSLPATIASSDVAQIMVKIDLRNGKRFQKNNEITEYLQDIFDKNIKGGRVTVNQLEQGEPIGAPIRIRITGDDIQKIEEAVGRIEDELKKIPGTMKVEDDLWNRQRELNVYLDDTKLSLHGITKYDVQNQINIALYGREATVLRKDGDEKNIIVRSNVKTLEELKYLPIKSEVTSGTMLLKDIAVFKSELQSPSINKYNRKISATILCDVKSDYRAIDIQNVISDKLDKINLKGVDVTFDGEKEKIRENFGNVGETAIFAIVIIYIILLFQFKSFIQPLIIMLTIPFSAVGSIIGLRLFKQPLSFTALLGVVSLIGIVVNNAIVLLDYINYEIRIGKNLDEACSDAAGKRFRPIMLTTITTIMGLTPLALSGSEFFRPMAIALMAGLMISTFLTLVIIPVVYNMVIGKLKTIKNN
ncbi:transporter [Fervidicella metallireducens AeB]|uniref:Transporter n=1 Tax=Fervidicella metallireducens AeB TaxID=1403537 RepID=A0A017RU05_9CLOT|nr:efflux RND transporter permease subunit [Fervidicella metallireducens]EYE87924.1 transporter [Fervidicella metallireducens AeB]